MTKTMPLPAQATTAPRVYINDGRVVTEWELDYGNWFRHAGAKEGRESAEWSIDGELGNSSWPSDEPVPQEAADARAALFARMDKAVG